jgi:hypothetical protein
MINLQPYRKQIQEFSEIYSEVSEYYVVHIKQLTDLVNSLSEEFFFNCEVGVIPGPDYKYLIFFPMNRLEVSEAKDCENMIVPPQTVVFPSLSEKKCLIAGLHTIFSEKPNAFGFEELDLSFTDLEIFKGDCLTSDLARNITSPIKRGTSAMLSLLTDRIK